MTLRSIFQKCGSLHYSKYIYQSSTIVSAWLILDTDTYVAPSSSSLTPAIFHFTSFAVYLSLPPLYHCWSWHRNSTSRLGCCTKMYLSAFSKCISLKILPKSSESLGYRKGKLCLWVIHCVIWNPEIVEVLQYFVVLNLVQQHFFSNKSG